MNKPTLQYIPLSQIEPDPNQPRRELESPDEVNEARTLAGLAESIMQYGILQPIRVRALDSKRFCIISGERRYKAALLAKLSEVPAIVIENSQVLLEQLIENVQRKAMTPLELADAIQQLLQTGLSGVEIAKKLGINTMQVSILAKLQTVSLPIREALQERLIVSPRAAYDLDKLPRHKQLELMAQARDKKQIIGQMEVRAARRTLSDSLVIKPYAPPLLAKIEYDALMAILNQALEGEQYNGAADRLAILKASGARIDGKVSNKKNDSFSSSINKQATQSETGIENVTNSEEDEFDNEGQQQKWQSPAPKEPLLRIPAFTLHRVELEMLAKKLGQTPPPGLADPGGWLVELIKRSARDN